MTLSYLFNKPLDNSFQGLQSLTRLVFGTYCPPNTTFNHLKATTYIASENNPDHLSDVNPHELHVIFSNNTNHQVEHILTSLYGTTHLTFNDGFNRPLGTILYHFVTLTHLMFGHDFNQPLNNSLNELHALTHLTFGCVFNQPLDTILHVLQNITYLTLGHNFNQPLQHILPNLPALTHHVLKSYTHEIEIPHGVEYLDIDALILSCIDRLPNSIQELILGRNFAGNLDNLPSSIHTLLFDTNSKFDGYLNNLPHGLRVLRLPKKYNKQIQIPANLERVVLGIDYEWIADFSGTIIETY